VCTRSYRVPGNSKRNNTTEAFSLAQLIIGLRVVKTNGFINVVTKSD